MTIKEALAKATKQFAINHFITPHLDAEILLSHVLNKPKEFLHTHPEKNLVKTQLKNFISLINKRLEKKPIAYLTKEKWFYGYKFYVNKDVLIPRPETEHLVEEALNITHKNNIQSILDLGTGSGNIVISLAKNLEKTKLVATDKFASALKVAKKNAKKLDCLSKVSFKKSNLFDSLDERFDMIISNLPYVPEFIEVNTGEPRKAIYGGKIGTEIYEDFFKQINNYINNQGFIIIEIDAPAHDSMKKIIKKYLPNSKIFIKQDYSNKNRMMVIRLT